MRRRLTLAALTATALLAACGSPEATHTADDTNITVPEGNTASALASLSDADRNATLFRAIRDAGRDCQSVTSSTAAGEMNGAPTWAATCDNNTQWVVAIGADGIATVTNAAELRAAQGG